MGHPILWRELDVGYRPPGFVRELDLGYPFRSIFVEAVRFGPSVFSSPVVKVIEVVVTGLPELMGI
jgi:hypothetical protein